MAGNKIEYAKSYVSVLDAVYKREATSTCLNSPARLARAGRNAKEIMIPKIAVSGLGDYTRNVGYKTGSINYAFETKTFNYDSNNASSWIRARLTNAVSCVRERAAAS